MYYDMFSGAKSVFIITTCVLFVVSLGMVALQIVPAFVDDTARAVNVSIPSTQVYGELQDTKFLYIRV